MVARRTFFYIKKTQSGMPPCPTSLTLNEILHCPSTCLRTSWVYITKASHKSEKKLRILVMCIVYYPDHGYHYYGISPCLHNFPLLRLNASVIDNPFFTSSSASTSASTIVGRISRTFATRFCGMQTAAGSGAGERKMRSPY